MQSFEKIENDCHDFIIKGTNSQTILIEKSICFSVLADKI